MVIQLPSSQVQQNFGAAVERALRGDDVIIERYGLPRAALVEYGRYQKLAAAEQALTQPVASPPPIHEAMAAYHTALSPTPTAESALDELTSAAPVGVGTMAYRYVTRTPEVCGGQPILRGTRVAVRTVVGYHKLGLSVDEILAALPHLTPAQVYEALSYYYDHTDEIEQEIRENQLPSLAERHSLQVAADGRITFRD